MKNGYLEELFRFGGGVDVAVSDTAGATQITEDQTAAKLIVLGGALTAARTVRLSARNRGADWILVNATTGGFAVTVQSATGAGVTVPSGSIAYAVYDGANMRKSDSFDPTAPGAVGGTTPAAGTFTTLTLTSGALTPTSSASFAFSQVARAAISTAQGGATSTFTAQNATAGSSVAGAAAGGGFAFTTGNAAQFTSGDAAGGDFVITLGAGIGAPPDGRPGKVKIVGNAPPSQLVQEWLNGSTTVATVDGSGNFQYAGKITAYTGNVPNFGRASVVMTADANFTVAATDYANHILSVTSSVSLTLTRNLILPLVNGALYTIRNGTTGAQSIVAIGATGAGVTIANGATARVYCDGTNYLQG